MKPNLWISLHDISPNVISKNKIVYLHNATAFAETNFQYLILQPKIFFFTLFYKFLYKFNLKKNTYIIVQQSWFRNKIVNYYKINSDKILISYPVFKFNFNIIEQQNSTDTIFFYPSLPRVFKNHELLCEAAVNLIKEGFQNFKLILTIDGTENKYSKSIFNKYSKYSNIIFLGFQNRSQLNDLYNKANIMIFPSKIESWGLPLSEFMLFKKPIFCSDLPYAKETLRNYKMVSFFNPNSINQIFILMKNAIDNKFTFDNSFQNYNDENIFNNWDSLFNKVLNFENDKV